MSADLFPEGIERLKGRERGHMIQVQGQDPVPQPFNGRAKET